MIVTETAPKARFDGQLPKEMKDFLERAARLAGFKTLSEFIFTSAQEKAENIVMNHETLLASHHDREIFFDAIMNPPKPNNKLKSAAQSYKNSLSE